jgi:hypothetical protein
MLKNRSKFSEFVEQVGAIIALVRAKRVLFADGAIEELVK